MQPTETLIPCNINFSTAINLLTTLGPKIFIAVPNAINGKLDKRPISIWVGRPEHIECRSNGSIVRSERFDSPQTKLLLNGFTVNDILEYQSEFRNSFEFKRKSNMVIWTMKK